MTHEIYVVAAARSAIGSFGPRRSPAEDTRALLAKIQPNGTRDFSEQEIIDRCMLPLIIEAAHALEEGIVASPTELNQALLLGIGVPAYLGGALKYAIGWDLIKCARGPRPMPIWARRTNPPLACAKWRRKVRRTTAYRRRGASHDRASGG